jgi:hypothetical protein
VIEYLHRGMLTVFPEQPRFPTNSEFLGRMSGPGQKLPKWGVRPDVRFSPIATNLRTSLMVRFVPNSQMASSDGASGLCYRVHDTVGEVYNSDKGVFT